MNKKLSGPVPFDGRLTIKIGKDQFRLFNDPECSMLIDADSDRKAIILTQYGLMTCEVQIGYVQHIANRMFVDRGWQTRQREMFSLKPTLSSATSTLIRFDEVIAWCYVDGDEPTADKH